MSTLIVSDIHLGSRNSQAGAFSRLLDTPFDRLVINGDLINSVNFKKLWPSHWAVLGKLRECARRREVVLVRGNHDGATAFSNTFGQLDVLQSLLGVRMVEEYEVELAGRRYLILHGDRFDPTLYTPIVTDAADWCYQAVQKVNKKAAKWLKRRAKKLGGVLEFVKRRAVQYAESLGCQGVITGHTHFSDDDWIDGIHYVNGGCWVDRPCTYVAIRDGELRLCHWEEDPVLAHGLIEAPETGDVNGQLGVRLAD
jgi:UDP-2,3-diacylglucosamine pyrophosphatase LpxH